MSNASNDLDRDSEKGPAGSGASPPNGQQQVDKAAIDQAIDQSIVQTFDQALDPSLDQPVIHTAPKSLGKAVGGGMSWMLIATVLAKLATSIAQFLLGWWLLPEHFARFAIATTIAGLLMIARDGGIPNFLIKRGPTEYETYAGPSFWMCLAYNSFAAVIMSLAAWPAALSYDDPKLAPMLWAMALALPLGTPAAVLFAKMRLDLQFKNYAMLVTTSAILRQVFTILLAKWGFDEMSLAWPVALTALFETVATWWVCSEKPWKRPAVFSMWMDMFRKTRWLMNGTVASFTSEWGPYLVLGKLLSQTQTGYYFFAYQITAQIGTLLSHNLHIVMMPVLSRMSDQPDRQRAAFLRVLKGLTLVASFFSLAVASIMAPLENLLWHGKWAPAVEAVVIFGIFYPWRVSFAITCAVMMARGEFKRYSLTAWFEGIVLITTSAIAAVIKPELMTVALTAGITLMIVRLIVTDHVCSRMGIARSEMLNAMLRGWIIPIIAAIPVYFIHHYASWDWVLTLLPTAWETTENKWIILLRDSTVHILRCAIHGTTYVICFIALVTQFMKAELHDAATLLPGRLQRIVTRFIPAMSQDQRL